MTSLMKNGYKKLAAAAAVAAAALALAGPAQAVTGGGATSGFLAVGIGVQVTPDWVFTVQHFALNPGETFGNGYGARIVAQRYDAPGSGVFPANDFTLLRLAPASTSAPYLPVLGQAIAEGTFAPLPVTIISALNGGSPRGFGYTQITESLVTADPDDGGPLGPVTVNWLASYDTQVHVEGGDSGGGLFAGHVIDSSLLLGLSSALFTDEQNNPLGSAFVQPAAYRGWIDATLTADLADTQAVLWTATPVPEPAAWLLTVAGLAALALRRRA